MKVNATKSRRWEEAGPWTGGAAAPDGSATGVPAAEPES